MADDDPQDHDEAARVVDEVADHAAGTGGRTRTGAGHAPGRSPDQTRAELADARHRLEAAWHSSSSGTDIPESARLRPVKQAMMVGLRPVTSHQVPFNRELVVAIDRLANAVEDVVGRVDGAEDRVDDTLRQLRAGIATVDVAGADVETDVAALREAVDDLTHRLERAEDDLAEQRRATAAARAREDLILRAARDVTGRSETVVDLTGEVDRADDSLLRRLARAGRPPADALRAQARAVVDVVVEAAVAAPVLDLASDDGTWLDVWAENGIEAIGVDDDPEAAERLAARGHAVVASAPVAHVASRPAGSLGAVTAAVLADVVALADLVELVDGAREALRPGGVLVLAAADPAGLAVGDPQWADPRRGPLHATTLVVLLLERGWAEAELVPLGDEAGASYVLVARTAGAAPAPPPP